MLSDSLEAYSINGADVYIQIRSKMLLIFEDLTQNLEAKKEAPSHSCLSNENLSRILVGILPRAYRGKNSDLEVKCILPKHAVNP